MSSDVADQTSGGGIRGGKKGRRGNKKNVVEAMNDLKSKLEEPVQSSQPYSSHIAQDLFA